MTAPALVIFDADGTLRRCTIPGQVCPNRDGEWELLPGVVERIAALAAAGARFAVVSNQGGVAAGHLLASTARSLLVALAAAAFPDPGAVHIALCPHPVRAGCRCRKPAPGMLLDALRWAGVEASAALMVGDMASDQEAAERAGCGFAWAWDFFGFEAPGRPVPAQRAHDLAQHRAILGELLDVERERLREALRIERERSMVFPETTVIVKDIQRLAAAVYGPAAGVEGASSAPASGSTAAGAGEGAAEAPGPAAPGRSASAGAAPGGSLDGLGADGDSADADAILAELAAEGEGEP